jgi:hypothetical protein
MNDTIGVDGTTVAMELEQRLAAAKKEKNFAQVPALRRLRMVVRVFFVVSVIAVIFSLAAGMVLRSVQQAVQMMDGSRVALALYAGSLWLSLAVALLTLNAYSRFLRQLKESHLQDIKDTTESILELFAFSIALSIASLILMLVILPNGALADSATSALPGFAMTVAMYFIVRHYVKTAQAELPALISEAGAEATRGSYRAQSVLVPLSLVIALVVLGLGYLVSGL